MFHGVYIVQVGDRKKKEINEYNVSYVRWDKNYEWNKAGMGDKERCSLGGRITILSQAVKEGIKDRWLLKKNLMLLREWSLIIPGGREF